MTGRETYPRSIVILHWTVVALVIAQLLTADGMEHYFRNAADTGVSPGFPGSGTALMHAGFGATILVLVITRFIIRINSKIPPPPSDLPKWMQVISRATHYGLYAALTALPVSGVIALLLAPEVGDVHKALKNVLYALAGAHILGALTHLLVLRDGVVGRILPVVRR
jgi:cytochrome b561